MSGSRSSGADRSQPAIFPLGQRERRIIFQEMVKAELEAGLLRYSKRRRLVGYAAKLSLPAFEANLMIAEVQQARRSGRPFRLLSREEVQARFEAARRRNRQVSRFLIATAAAAAVNLLIINWILF